MKRKRTADGSLEMPDSRASHLSPTMEKTMLQEIAAHPQAIAVAAIWLLCFGAIFKVLSETPLAEVRGLLSFSVATLCTVGLLQQFPATPQMAFSYSGYVPFYLFALVAIGILGFVLRLSEIRANRRRKDQLRVDQRRTQQGLGFEDHAPDRTDNSHDRSRYER